MDELEDQVQVERASVAFMLEDDKFHYANLLMDLQVVSELTK